MNIKDQQEKFFLIIWCDAVQLPPIDSESVYIFNGGHFNEFKNNSLICKLKEVKRQNNKEFVELLERVRITIHTKDDLKFIENMKNNNVDENDCVYMCAKKNIMLIK